MGNGILKTNVGAEKIKFKMGKITKFITENYIALLIGLCFYGLFLYATVEGNRICDCESTENYKPSNTGHSSVNRFYHK